MTLPPQAAEPDPLLGRVLNGRYRVESRVARGGMAVVYRGADLLLERTVAIKVMHASFAADPAFVERFAREARATARLSTPHVVNVHDQGEDHGVTYLVMEFVPGHTVRDVLRSHGPLPPTQALAVLDPVLEALAAAHRAGYIHRDIKPENVLISDDGRVKVTDFGLARAIESNDAQATTGILLGTVAYLSPEQVQEGPTDARSDVYGAGILLYELVTGKVPYSAAGPMQVAYKHVHEEVPKPSSIRAGIPSEVDDLVRRATRRDPAHRFPNAEAFLTAIRAVRAGLPPPEPWAPTPTDTLVVPTGTPAKGQAARDPRAAVAVGVAMGTAAGAAAAGTQQSSPKRPEATATSSSSSSTLTVSPADSQHSNASTDSARTSPPPTGGSAPSGQSPPDGRPSSEGQNWGRWGSGGDWDDDQLTEASNATNPEESPKRRRRGRRLAFWLAAVALLSVGALLLLVFGPFLRVKVPDVVGQTPAQATAVLASVNLHLDSGSSDFSEDVAQGHIISTDPGPNRAARNGTTVIAVVSKGPERYDVPDLKDLTVEEAQVALGAANMVLGTQTPGYHDKIKSGHIINSDPKAGEPVKRDTAVAVTVSQGPAPVVLPVVEGASADAATKTLEDLGLKVDRSEKHNESVDKDQVISSDPVAGTTVHRGDTVKLVVSKGPPLVTVPNVVGKSRDSAISALENAGLKASVYYPLGFSALNLVNTQSPKGGDQIPKGSSVRIGVV